MSRLQHLLAASLTACVAFLTLMSIAATTDKASPAPRDVPSSDRGPSARTSALGIPVATLSSRPGAIVTGVNTDTPDPFILHDHGGYYLYSGEAYWHGRFVPVMVAFSRNPRHFPPPTPAMPAAPAWTAQALTWSPDVVRVGPRYEMYFASMSVPALGGQQCIGTASATSPAGPFVPDAKPMICDRDHFGALDPRVVSDTHGNRWLLWKSNDNANPSPFRSPSAIISQPLGLNGRYLTGTRHYLLHADQAWQQGIIEAPDLVNAHGHYWLFYSGGLYTTASYGIGVASCEGPAGPCTDLSSRPWLSSNAQGQGPGEASVLDDSQGRSWLVYDINDGEQRRGDTRPAAIAPVSFAGRYPQIVL